MDAAIYARLSLDKAGNGIKVADQIADCQAHASTLGLTVREVYEDNDISATTGKRRPGFEALLKDKPAVVIVWHQDRLLRVSKDLERVLDAGFVVHQVTAGTLDLATPTGRAVARTVAAWSTFEGEHKAERQKAAIRKRAIRGDAWWSHRPFGYNEDTTIRESEAAPLRQAFTDLLNGKSSYRIAQEWNEAGIKQAETPNPWEGRRVSQLFRQARYAGLSTYKGEVVGPAQWEAIIDQGTFYAAQAILSDPKRRVGGAPRYSLLSGVLVCGRCDAAGKPKPSMNRWKGTRPSGTTFDRYRCNTCQFMVDAQWAEDTAVRDHFEYLTAAVAEVVEDGEHQDTTEEIERLQSRLSELGAAYGREAIDLAQLEAGTTSIRERIKTLREQAASSARARVASPEDIRKNWDAMTTDEQRDSMARKWRIVALKDQDGTKHLHWQPTGTDVLTPGAPLAANLRAYQPR